MRTLSAALAGLAVAVLAGLPRSSGMRLAALGPRAGVPLVAAPGHRIVKATWFARSRAGTSTGPLMRRQRSLSAAAAGCVAGIVGGPAFGLLVLAGVTVAMRALVRRRSVATARDERLRAVEACLAVAAELRAGRAPAEALHAAAELAVGPSRVALERAARAAELGGDVPDALTSVAGSAVPELLRSLGACWRVCATAGSGLAVAVERLADGLAADAARRRAVAAELAGPRATAGLLALLPLAGVLLASGLGADPWQVLFHTPLGATCLLLGVGLDLLGLWWTGRLVDRALMS